MRSVAGGKRGIKVEVHRGAVPVRAVAAVTAVTILALWLAAARPLNLALFSVAGVFAIIAIALGLAAASRFGRGVTFSGAGLLRTRCRGDATSRPVWTGHSG